MMAVSRGDKCKGCGVKAARSKAVKGHLSFEHKAGCKFEVDYNNRRMRGQAVKLGGDS